MHMHPKVSAITRTDYIIKEMLSQMDASPKIKAGFVLPGDYKIPGIFQEFQEQCKPCQRCMHVLPFFALLQYMYVTTQPHPLHHFENCEKRGPSGDEVGDHPR